MQQNNKNNYVGLWNWFSHPPRETFKSVIQVSKVCHWLANPRLRCQLPSPLSFWDITLNTSFVFMCLLSPQMRLKWGVSSKCGLLVCHGATRRVQASWKCYSPGDEDAELTTLTGVKEGQRRLHFNSWGKNSPKQRGDGWVGVTAYQGAGQHHTQETGKRKKKKCMAYERQERTGVKHESWH